MSIKVENWEEKKPQTSDMHKRMTAKIIAYDVKPTSLIFFSSLWQHAEVIRHNYVLPPHPPEKQAATAAARNSLYRQQVVYKDTPQHLFPVSATSTVCYRNGLHLYIPRHSRCPHLRHDSPITSKMECAAASPCRKFTLCALSH